MIDADVILKQCLKNGYPYTTSNQIYQFSVKELGSSPFKFTLNHDYDILTDFKCNVPYTFEIGGLPSKNIQRIMMVSMWFHDAKIVIDLETIGSVDTIYFSCRSYSFEPAMRHVFKQKPIVDGPLLYMSGMSSSRNMLRR
jgi:hypothetical protein